jgi:hypothetical protein
VLLAQEQKIGKQMTSVSTTLTGVRQQHLVPALIAGIQQQLIEEQDNTILAVFTLMSRLQERLVTWSHGMLFSMIMMEH